MPPTSVEPAKMLTLDQVAELLQIDPRAVRKLCAAGDLEFVKINSKTLRFKPEWIEALIKRKQGRPDGKWEGVEGRRRAAG